MKVDQVARDLKVLLETLGQLVPKVLQARQEALLVLPDHRVQRVQLDHRDKLDPPDQQVEQVRPDPLAPKDQQDLLDPRIL